MKFIPLLMAVLMMAEADVTSKVYTNLKKITCINDAQKEVFTPRSAIIKYDKDSKTRLISSGKKGGDVYLYDYECEK